MRHRISLALLLALLLVGYAAWAYPPHRGGMGYGSAGTPPIGTLTGIALANNSFVAPASDGTVVGAITVQGSGSIAGATLSVTGDGGLCPGSSCPFRLSNTTVPSNLLVNGTQNAGTYSINLVATLAGAVGSPFTQPETVTGAALTITGVSISCGSSCVFTPPGATGTAIGTLSATVSSGSPSVTWALSASADICNPTNGAGNANFQIAGNVVQVKTSNLGSGTYQLCATASGSYGNSPQGLAFTVTGTSLPPGFFVATNGTNNGTCSISQPCTFAAAQTAMQNSSTKRTYVRAGTYNALNYPTFNGCVSSSVMILLGASDSNETWQYYPPDGINTALFNAGPGRTFGETQNRQKAFCIEQATNVTINGLAFWYWHTGAAILSPGNGALIENNQIYYNYENILSPVAVIGGSTGAKIYHNDIEHIYGAAVNVQSGGENIDMRYNFVDDSCLSTDGGSPPGSDCGGLYNIGVNSGTFIGNYVRNTSVPSNGNGGRCIYLDETANNQTVNGNICTGIFGETLFNHASNHDNMNSNISDLWNQFDQQFLASQYSSPPNTDMLGNTFQHNIVVTKNNGGGGNGATNFGVPNPNPTTINDNLYFNYGTGGNVFAGGSPDVVNGTGSDPNPTRSNPLFLTCPGGGVDSWSFKLNPTSPAFSAPVSFPAQGNNDVGIAWGQPGFWGPPGFTIPHTGTPPSYGPCATGTSTITGLSLSSTTYTSSTQGTLVGNLVLSGANNSATTFALSGPDAARFQLSSPCTGASCTLQASGTEPDGYHDGKFLVFITPTLAGATGSRVVYPFTVNETVTCSQTVASGFAAANITSAIAAASAGQNICIQGSGTIASTVTVNKGVRITGVNSATAPSITVSGNILVFNVTVANAQIDHLNASATLINAGGATDSCSPGTPPGSDFVETHAFNGFLTTYNHTSGFNCTYWFNGTTNPTAKFNYDTLMSNGVLVCDVCIGGLFNNNWVQDSAPTSTTGQGNSYPIVSTSDGAGTLSATNNVIINNPVWECLDQHGGIDVHYISNYCLGIAGIQASKNVAINAGGNSGITLTRPFTNGNYIDQGSISCAGGCDAITQGAFSGGSMVCGAGQCQVENNTVLGMGDTSSCNTILTGAQGGSMSGTQVVSGNTCGGAVATMALPVLTTDQPSNGFVAGQANGVIGKITVAVTPSFPAWVGGWPNYGGWPGTFTLGGANASSFRICVDGQHLCQAPGGTAAGSYSITITGTLNGLSNSPRTSGTITLTGS